MRFSSHSSSTDSAAPTRPPQKSTLEQRARRPDDRDAQERGAQSHPTQLARILARGGRHALAHRFGETRHQQPFDGENEADRDAEVPHGLNPPWPPAEARSRFRAREWGSKSNGRSPTSG